MLLRSNLKKRKKKLRREKGTEKRGGEIVGSTHSRKVVLIQIDSSPHTTHTTLPAYRFIPQKHFRKTEGSRVSTKSVQLYGHGREAPKGKSGGSCTDYEPPIS